MSSESKPLGSEDKSGAEFVREMLKGDNTFGINFDRIQWTENGYVIIEFLFCDPKQFDRGITPYNSHPNKYFFKNSQKFIQLWRLANIINAKLYLVNYTEKGNDFEDEILLMEVRTINKDQSEPVKTTYEYFTRNEFSDWFRELNAKGNHA
ncbi:MAG: hypothetical protein GTN97_03560 [Nitrosopumilaceae archaeon]|nr:hypothetical protein [Nitrosopumilaceae archaeon]